MLRELWIPLSIGLGTLFVLKLLAAVVDRIAGRWQDRQKNREAFGGNVEMIRQFRADNANIARARGRQVL